MSSGIPFYRLPDVLRDHPELGEVSRLSLKGSLGCVRLALWDEQRRRLVSFREARASQRLPDSG
jgi:omega-6 fatty acid desaturase (delta-12 desaturase)